MFNTSHIPICIWEKSHFIYTHYFDKSAIITYIIILCVYVLILCVMLKKQWSPLIHKRKQATCWFCCDGSSCPCIAILHTIAGILIYKNLISALFGATSVHIQGARLFKILLMKIPEREDFALLPVAHVQIASHLMMKLTNRSRLIVWKLAWRETWVILFLKFRQTLAILRWKLFWMW